MDLGFSRGGGGGGGFGCSKFFWKNRSKKPSAPPPPPLPKSAPEYDVSFWLASILRAFSVGLFTFTLELSQKSSLEKLFRLLSDIQTSVFYLANLEEPVEVLGDVGRRPLVHLHSGDDVITRYHHPIIRCVQSTRQIHAPVKTLQCCAIQWQIA